MAEQAEFTDIGDSVIRVEQLLKEHKKLEGEGQVCFLLFLWTGKEVAVDSDRSCPLIIVGRLLKDTGMPKSYLFSHHTATPGRGRVPVDWSVGREAAGGRVTVGTLSTGRMWG